MKIRGFSAVIIAVKFNCWTSIKPMKSKIKVNIRTTLGTVATQDGDWKIALKEMTFSVII
jgi:hypothetical protein